MIETIPPKIDNNQRNAQGAESEPKNDNKIQRDRPKAAVIEIFDEKPQNLQMVFQQKQAPKVIKLEQD